MQFVVLIPVQSLSLFVLQVWDWLSSLVSALLRRLASFCCSPSASRTPPLPPKPLPISDYSALCKALASSHYNHLLCVHRFLVGQISDRSAETSRLSPTSPSVCSDCSRLLHSFNLSVLSLLPCYLFSVMFYRLALIFIEFSYIPLVVFLRNSLILEGSLALLHIKVLTTCNVMADTYVYVLLNSCN